MTTRPEPGVAQLDEAMVGVRRGPQPTGTSRCQDSVMYFVVQPILR